MIDIILLKSVTYQERSGADKQSKSGKQTAKQTAKIKKQILKLRTKKYNFKI